MDKSEIKKYQKVISQFMTLVGSNKELPPVEFKGRMIPINYKLINQLFNAFTAEVIKLGRNGRKKNVSPETKTETIKTIRRNVDYALTNGKSLNISSSFRNIFLGELDKFLNDAKIVNPGKMIPKHLSFIDDYLVDFFRTADLGLLCRNLNGQPVSVTRELEETVVQFKHFLEETRVGSSTVFVAAINLYSRHNSLRSNTNGNFYIKLDDKLRKLIEAPLSSSFNEKSYAEEYSKTRDEKTSKVGSFRIKYPQKSILDWWKAENPDNYDDYQNDKIKSNVMMQIVNSHLIPTLVFKEDSEFYNQAISKVVDGAHVNPNVNTLIALQAFITCSTMDKKIGDAPRKVPYGRSPSRSPARGRSPARSPGKRLVASPARISKQSPVRRRR